jgi:hypothetical protein
MSDQTACNTHSNLTANLVTPLGGRRAENVDHVKLHLLSTITGCSPNALFCGGVLR